MEKPTLTPRDARSGDQRQGPAQVLRRARGGAGDRPRGRRRRDLRLPRTERRGEDDHGRDPRGLPGRATRARSACWGSTPSGRTAPGATGSASSSRSRGWSRSSPRGRRWSSTRATTPRRGTSTRRSSLVGPRREGGRPDLELSGGQQRRLDVALALIGDPELLFLDEPTTGFDPSARRQAWDVIGGLRDLGKTVFLTTHYMDEAQALADRVAIISAGRIVATGSPEDLGGDRESARRSASGSRRGTRGAICPSRTREGPDRRRRGLAERRGPGAAPPGADRLGARRRGRAARARGPPPEPRGRLPRAHRARRRAGEGGA